MRILYIVFLLPILCTAEPLVAANEPVINEHIIEMINSLTLGWSARAHNIFLNRTIRDVRYLTGLIMPTSTSHGARFKTEERQAMYQRTALQIQKLAGVSDVGAAAANGYGPALGWWPFPTFPPFFPTLFPPNTRPPIVPVNPIVPTDKPVIPTVSPTKSPTANPGFPTMEPIINPTETPTSRPTNKPTPNPSNGIPTSFDAREQWGTTCPSLHDIRDQSTCGSCWAFCTASVATDRTCIASNGAQQPYLSAQDILTCCGSSTCGTCDGGYLKPAFDFWTTSGVVTGGAKGDTNTCKPYFLPCKGTGCSSGTPTCTRTCQASYTTSYQQDKSYGDESYDVADSVQAIQLEIMTNGPVAAGFYVYADFMSYSTGVYQHVSGSQIGGHAVKLIGWGAQNGKPYWLAANSWGTQWGEAGFFKIIRGVNEGRIEEMVSAGTARV